MPQVKKPTLKQKKQIRAAGKDPKEWYIEKAPAGLLHLKHKYTKTKKVISA